MALSLLLTLFCVGGVHARAAGVSASTQPVVGEASFRRLNVFDPAVPGEDWWPFRMANRIHIPTREDVVRRELLLPPGGRFDPLRAIETERNLRALGFIRKAEVTLSTASASGANPLTVTTQDAWTLAPQLSVGTEGGDSYFSYGVREGNLLGMGKAVSVLHSQVGPDVRNEARYEDPRLSGSRWAMTDLYATSHHGDEIGVLLDRPFFSLDTLGAGRLSWSRIIEEDILYKDAEQSSKFLQHYNSVTALGGLRTGSQPDWVRRAHAGYYYARSRFESTPDTTAGTLPENRSLSGPVAGYSWVQPHYVKQTDIDSMQRVEDFNLGNEFQFLGGPMLTSLGSDRDRWIYSAQDQQGLEFSDDRFLLGLAGIKGRLAAGKPENALAYASANLFWKARWPAEQTFVAHLEGAVSRRLDAENQLLLGGSTGLRGYKNDSFTGGRSALLNLESRFFNPRDYFHLVYTGAVVFFETGQTAAAGGPLSLSGLKSDAGFGLRLSPSRSSGGGVLRMDVAYALNGGPGPSRVVVSIRGGQAFSLFGSTAHQALRSPDASLSDSSDSRRR